MDGVELGCVVVDFVVVVKVIATTLEGTIQIAKVVNVAGTAYILAVLILLVENADRGEV